MNVRLTDDINGDRHVDHCRRVLSKDEIVVERIINAFGLRIVLTDVDRIVQSFGNIRIITRKTFQRPLKFGHEQ